MKIKKRLLALFVSLSMVFSSSVSALAAGQQRYEYSYENLNIAVEYIAGETTVTEKITIHEEGFETIIVEKIVSEDGTIMVYQDGIQTGVLHDGNYDQYVAMTQDQIVFESSHRYNSGYATNGCGYSQNHSYVSSNKQTVDIGLNNTVGSIAATILGALMCPVAGAALGIITAIIQRAVDNGADYIDISETKYFVHGAYANDMNCYHALYTYYNKTASGGKNVIGNEWVYSQELI